MEKDEKGEETEVEEEKLEDGDGDGGDGEEEEGKEESEEGEESEVEGGDADEERVGDGDGDGRDGGVVSVSDPAAHQGGGGRGVDIAKMLENEIEGIRSKKKVGRDGDGLDSFLAAIPLYHSH